MQLPTYNILKNEAVDRGVDSGNPFLHATCSIISAGISIIFCNPSDVIRTRIYNQPFDRNGNGIYYKNSLDALIKIVKHEGPSALYKGALAHFSRLGPHLMLVFLILEKLKTSS